MPIHFKNKTNVMNGLNKKRMPYLHNEKMGWG